MDRAFAPAASTSGRDAELFVDMMSQPSRACVLFAHLCGLPIRTRVTVLGKREQRAADFPNPLRQVPCLREGDGFVLPESGAILRYLAVRHGVPDHWYPREPRARARVDAAVDWYHSNVRRGAAGTLWAALVARNVGLPLDPAAARNALGVLRLALEKLERVWLVDGAGPFMSGEERPSIADLLVSEVRPRHLVISSVPDSATHAHSPLLSQELFQLTLLEAVDDDVGLPPSLDALLGDASPRSREFLRACRSLDADAWNRTHHLLERAKALMLRRKAKEAAEGASGASARARL